MAVVGAEWKWTKVGGCSG